MTANVASILAIYGLGLPGFVMIKALNPGFFAREDTKTPMRFTGISVAVNCACAVSLFPFFTERGIATAEVVAGWTSVTLLFTTLLRRGHWVWERAFGIRILKLVASALVMAFLVNLASVQAAPWLQPDSPLIRQIAAVLGLIGLAMLIYFTLAFATGGASLRQIAGGMVRKAAPSAGDPPTDGLE
jgi:putative peptidoglycan lipid II flippase